MRDLVLFCFEWQDQFYCFGLNQWRQDLGWREGAGEVGECILLAIATLGDLQITYSGARCPLEFKAQPKAEKQGSSSPQFHWWGHLHRSEHWEGVQWWSPPGRVSSGRLLGRGGFHLLLGRWHWLASACHGQLIGGSWPPGSRCHIHIIKWNTIGAKESNMRRKDGKQSLGSAHGGHSLRAKLRDSDLLGYRSWAYGGDAGSGQGSGMLFGV